MVVFEEEKSVEASFLIMCLDLGFFLKHFGGSLENLWKMRGSFICHVTVIYPQISNKPGLFSITFKMSTL